MTKPKHPALIITADGSDNFFGAVVRINTRNRMKRLRAFTQIWLAVIKEVDDWKAQVRSGTARGV